MVCRLSAVCRDILFFPGIAIYVVIRELDLLDSLILVRHSAPTIALHWNLFFAIFSSSPHVFPMLSSSFVTVRLHGCFDLHSGSMSWPFWWCFLPPSSRYAQSISIFFVIATPSCPILAHISSKEISYSDLATSLHTHKRLFESRVSALWEDRWPPG